MLLFYRCSSNPITSKRVSSNRPSLPTKDLSIRFEGAPGSMDTYFAHLSNYGETIARPAHMARK